jgi:hypothetical protein
MDYLTNYYRNLSEQLQDKVNTLSSQIKFLNEEAAAQTMSVAGEASEKAPDAPYAYNPHAYTPPIKSSTSKIKKPNQPNNSPEEDIEDKEKIEKYTTGDDALDEWLNDHQMPNEGDYDLDGDGVLNDEERQSFCLCYCRS